MAELTLTSDNFTQEVLQPDVPVLVDFWAEWCGPCKMMAPIVDEAASELGSKARVGKVNVDQFPDIAQQYNILSIPTFIIFKGGQVVEQFSGAMPKEALVGRLEKHI